MGAVLSVENLRVSLGKELVLENLSFGVERGEVLTILGPNGAGKSTLLESILGLISYEGKVRWQDDLNLSYLPADVGRDKFTAVPMTTAEFFTLKGVDREPAALLLKEVGLGRRFLDRSPDKLSSGEFQRVLLAWTIAREPDVVLLDEPTEGIDVGGKETVYSLLHRFWERRNLTVILVTHDLSIVYGHSDNVLCLRKRGLCYGSPEKVLTPDRLRELYGHDVKFYGHA